MFCFAFLVHLFLWRESFTLTGGPYRHEIYARGKAMTSTGEFDVSNLYSIAQNNLHKWGITFVKSPAGKTFTRRKKWFLPCSDKDDSSQPEAPWLEHDIIRAHEQHAEKPGEDSVGHLIPNALHRWGDQRLEGKHYNQRKLMKIFWLSYQYCECLILFEGSGPANPLKTDDFNERIRNHSGMNSHSAPLVQAASYIFKVNFT